MQPPQNGSGTVPRRRTGRRRRFASRPADACSPERERPRRGRRSRAARATGSASNPKEWSDGDQAQRLAAIAQGAGGIFTGTVRVDPLFQAPAPEPGRRRQRHVRARGRGAWHTHPLGQTLIVTSGLGWVQREGGPIEEIRPGDVVWFPPGLKHWHGATPTTAMTHIAITGIAQRQECRLAGAGQRRAIPQMI